MRRYNTILQDMQRAILEADDANADDFYPAKASFSPQEQIGVYITAYRLRMLGVIHRKFPASRYYLDDRWDGLVQAFIEATPSTSYNIDKYPLGLPAWISEKCDDPFAHDLVRLETYLEEVYTLQDSEALDPAWLAAQSQHALENTIFRARNALKATEFSFPVHDYLSDFRNVEKADTPPAKTQYLVICRHNNAVNRYTVSADEFSIFNAITSGKSLVASLEYLEENATITTEQTAEKLQEYFSRWLKRGWLLQI